MVEAGPIGDTEWANISANGDRLPLGYTADGRLDGLARQVWREDTVGIFDHDAPSDWSHALTTEDGRLLFGIKTSGEIIDPGLVGGGGPVSQDVYVHSDGTVQHTMADMAQVTTWGSSTPDLMTDALAVVFSDADVEVAKQAKGGEWIEHHAARLGVVPALIDPVTIPASGAVVVTVSNFPALSYAMLPYTGTLAGVHGTLAASQLGDGSTEFTFTRTTAGPEVVLNAPTELFPDVGPTTRDHVIILGPGKIISPSRKRVNRMSLSTRTEFSIT